MGGSQIIQDFLTPSVTAADLGVPPDRNACGFECVNQRLDAATILSLVGDKYVRHGAAPVRRQSIAEWLQWEPSQCAPAVCAATSEYAGYQSATTRRPSRCQPPCR